MQIGYENCVLRKTRAEETRNIREKPVPIASVDYH